MRIDVGSAQSFLGGLLAGVVLASSMVAPLAAQRLDRWNVSEATDPIDDSRSVSAGISKRDVGGTVTTMLLNCRAGAASVGFHSGALLFSTTQRPPQTIEDLIRFDSDPAVPYGWVVFGSIAGLAGSDGLAVIRRVVDARRVALRINTVTIVFDLPEDTPDAVAQILEACD